MISVNLGIGLNIGRHVDSSQFRLFNGSGGRFVSSLPDQV